MEKVFVVAVCGATASGKTKLAATLGKRLGGEVISADSMQIYKGMDIATAKPTQEEMLGVPHHLIGFLPPEQPFSVADYVLMAREKIAEVRARGNLPIICGGTGLYINSLLDNIEFDDTGSDAAFREEMRAFARENGNAALLEKLREVDPQTANELHENNQSRIIRALEVFRVSGVTLSEAKRKSRENPSPYLPCMLMPDYADRGVLYERIDRRVDAMAQAGLFEEARGVFLSGELPTAAQAICYKELFPYFRGEATKEECIEALKQSTRRYAKRQLTWFRKDERIHRLPADASPINFENLIDFAEKIVKSYSF